MASVVLAGDTSGSITLSAPLVAGSNVITVPAASGGLSMLGGEGQTWQDVAASRVSGTTYTNSTGKPIQVSISTVWSASNITVGGVIIASPSTTQINGFSFIVPNGATYVVTGLTAGFRWAELR